MAPFLKQKFRKAHPVLVQPLGGPAYALARVGRFHGHCLPGHDYFLNQPEMRVLYTNMSPEDASRVVDLLKSSKDAL
jgi:flagellar M-ring protein FliF